MTSEIIPNFRYNKYMRGLSRTVKKMLYYSGYYGIRYSINGRTNKDTFLVLMYHDLVSRDECHGNGSCSRNWFHPTVEQFENQLRILKREFNIYSVEYIVESLHKTGKVPGPCAAITFDDGYESFYTLAYPLLRRYKLPATVFLVPDWINGKMLPWWERLFNLTSLYPSPETLIRALSEIDLNSGSDSKLGTFLEMAPLPRLIDVLELFLKSITSEKREMVIRKIESVTPGFREYNIIPRPITWGQAVEVAQNGIRLGSHSMSHINILQEPIDKFEAEARESKIEIETRTGVPVDGFAFPYGFVGKDPAKSMAILRKAGYKYACTTVPLRNQKDRDPFEISRITLPFTDSRALIHLEMMQGFLS